MLRREAIESPLQALHEKRPVICHRGWHSGRRHLAGGHFPQDPLPYVRCSVGLGWIEPLQGYARSAGAVVMAGLAVLRRERPGIEVICSEAGERRESNARTGEDSAERRPQQRPYRT